MLSVYPAIFYKESDGQYSIVFPDLNHLSTCGKDLQEAMSMAVDCLAGYIYEAKLEHEELPAASLMDSIDIDAEYDGYESAFVNMVMVDVELYAKEHFNKAVKKTLTIPKWLNDAAVAHHLNFSKILQEALKEKLAL